MQIKDLTRSLRDAIDHVIEIDADEAVSAVCNYDAQFDQVEDRLVDLVRKRAGVLPTEPGDSPEQRLNSPRLTTTYPSVRKDALRKIKLDNERLITQLIGPLVTAMIAKEFAQAEFQMEEERSERVRIAKSEHRRTGIYSAVAAVADRLHDDYRVTYHHWRTPTAAQMEAIARILLGEPS